MFRGATSMNKWHRSLCGLIVTAICASFVGQAASQSPPTENCITIVEVIQLARQVSPQASIAAANVDVRNSRLGEVRAGGWPQFQTYGQTFSGDTELSGTRITNQLGLRATQDLFDFSKRRLQADAARAEVRAAKASVALAQHESALAAAEAYLGLLQAQSRQVPLIAEQTTLRELVTALSELLSSGAVTSDEVRGSNARLAIIEAQIASLRLSEEEALAALQFEVGQVNVQRCLVENLRDSLTGQRYSTLGLARTIDMALLANPRLRQLDALLDARDAEREYEKRSNFPTLRAVGTLSYASDDLRNDWHVRDQIGLEFSIPIGTGGAKPARIRGATARHAAVQRERQLLTREIEKEARLATGTYDAGVQLVATRQAVVEEKAAQLTLITEAFDQGFRTLRDLVEVRSELTRAEIDLLDAQFSMFHAALRLHLLISADTGNSRRMD